jgi:hypothetical protein
MLARNEPRASGAVALFSREAYQEERSMTCLTLRKGLALALLTTLAVSTAAIYGGEKPVASDEEGKVTLDADSVQAKGQYVRARFWTYTGEARVPVVATVDGCDKGSGKISYSVLDPQNSKRDAKVGLWDSDGDKVIDRMAAAACEHAKAASDTSETTPGGASR